MAKTFLAALALASASLLGATAASAGIVAADHGNTVWNAYDQHEEVYSMKFRDDGSKDGFWLVVSPGPNPKTNVNEYAVLYGDRANDRITAYTYNGENNPNSYRTGDYLGTFDNVFTDGGNGTTMFSLDVSDINAAIADPMWVGVELGSKAGIWFHETEGTQIAYGPGGAIADFGFDSQIWLDSGNVNTSGRACNANSGAYYCKNPTGLTNGSVPAPGGLALVLLGLAGFGMRRKK